MLMQVLILGSMMFSSAHAKLSEALPRTPLLPRRDVRHLKPAEFEAHVERLRVALLYYEEHVGKQIVDDRSARLGRGTWPWSLLRIEEAEAQAAPSGRAGASGHATTPGSPGRNGRDGGRAAGRSSGAAGRGGSGEPEQTGAALAARPGGDTTTPSGTRAADGARGPGDAKAEAKPTEKPTDCKDTKDATDGFRCIYAGWVARGDKCEPQAAMKFKYVEGGKTQEKKLECKKDETLCNPIIFGVIRNGSDIKPVCVSKVEDKRNTSRECYYEAKGKAKVTADDWTQNEKAHQDFEDGFNSMCAPCGLDGNKYFKDRPRAKKDMTDTCSWLYYRMNENEGKAGATTEKRGYNADSADGANDGQRNEPASAK